MAASTSPLSIDPGAFVATEHSESTVRSGPGADPRRRLRVAVLLKTNSGGLWVLPQVEALRRRGHQVDPHHPARCRQTDG